MDLQRLMNRSSQASRFPADACERSAERCSDVEPFGDARLSTERVAQIARGLAHPARVAIVEQLSDGRPRRAGDIVRESGLAPSTVSEHLRVLREADILASRRDGPRVCYCLRQPVLARFAAALAALVDEPLSVGT
ncbi:MAG: metalloregulator ArsR/SmtB family transcription factor [Acidimicrobiia bacterium]|nr:metalloregulator ArsR/SmtB family transcription factor [Acidimicrobiia bacterium]